MGGFQVSVGEPEENKQLRKKILDAGLLPSNRAASARKRVENKAAGRNSHFFAGECTERGSRVKSLRFAPTARADNIGTKQDVTMLTDTKELGHEIYPGSK